MPWEAGKEKPLPRLSREGRERCAYCEVFVLSVSVRVAEPTGVSMRLVERVRDLSVVDGCDLPVSMFTLVEELDAGGVGSVVVVAEELDVAGADGAGWTTVVEELEDGGASVAVGSFTTVVEEVLPVPGRSQPASAAMASAARGSMMGLIEVSVLNVGTS